MNIEKLLANPRFRWERAPAPDPQILQDFLSSAPPNLPRTYVRLLQQSNGGSGPNPFDSGAFALWPVEEIGRRNQRFGLAERAPGYFGFADNGAGRVYLFDLRAPDGAPVCSIAEPADGEEPKQLRSSFSEALESMMLVGVH
jgi:SMI1/KNR4 family protein SUKH-1